MGDKFSHLQTDSYRYKTFKYKGCTYNWRLEKLYDKHEHKKCDFFCSNTFASSILSSTTKTYWEKGKNKTNAAQSLRLVFLGLNLFDNP